MTQHEVAFSPVALRQLEELRRFIAARASPDIANRYVDRILAQCRKLDTFPHRGTKRDSIRPGLRTIGFEHSATIAFRVVGSMVYVVGIAYQGRSLSRTLARR